MKFLLLFLWSIRPCFVCGARASCAHREPELDIAWYEAERRRMARAAAAAQVPDAQLSGQPWLPGLAPEEVYRVQ